MRVVAGAILIAAGAVAFASELLADVLCAVFQQQFPLGRPAYLGALLTSSIGCVLLAQGIFKRTRSPQPPYGDQTREARNSG
jgi:hypothetical protein